MGALPWTVGIGGNAFACLVLRKNFFRLLLLVVFKNPDGGPHSGNCRATFNGGEKGFSADLCGNSRNLEETRYEMGFCMMLGFENFHHEESLEVAEL